MKPLTDEQRMAILDEIIALSMASDRQAYQFTGKEYAERVGGITAAGATHRLERLTDKGALKKARMSVGGRRCNVYWRPEDEPQASRE